MAWLGPPDPGVQHPGSLGDIQGSVASVDLKSLLVKYT